MLRRILIGNFKSYKRADLPLSPLTVLIGANASGKSNAIEALHLLSWIAQGNRLGNIRYTVSAGEQVIRGTTGNLPRDRAKPFLLGARSDDRDWPSYTIDVEVDEDEDLRISKERVEPPPATVPLFQVVGRTGDGGGSDLRVAYNNFARGGRKPQVTCTDQMAVLSQLQSAARFEAGHKKAQSEIPETCARWQKVLGDILFLDPQPSLMRGYSHFNEHRLRGDGSNLSGVLFGLCHTDYGEEQILSLTRSLPEQDVAEIDFVETPRDEVMVKLAETFGGAKKWFDATLLSDGTLRVLSIAAAILSAPKGSLVVIEEIDNGVHPSRAGMLLEGIYKIAKDRDLRILLSSHNPALLDALPGAAVPHVVFCYRDPEDGSSRLVRLQDIPDYPELIAQGSVGHLMTRGIIERFVKQHPGPEARKKKAREWLEGLQSRVG